MRTLIVSAWKRLGTWWDDYTELIVVGIFFVASVAGLVWLCKSGPTFEERKMDSPVWIYDDSDAGVRCYGAENCRWSCVKVR